MIILVIFTFLSNVRNLGDISGRSLIHSWSELFLDDLRREFDHKGTTCVPGRPLESVNHAASSSSINLKCSWRLLWEPEPIIFSFELHSVLAAVRSLKPSFSHHADKLFHLTTVLRASPHLAQPSLSALTCSPNGEWHLDSSPRQGQRDAPLLTLTLSPDQLASSISHHIFV